jgi:hypothetical protein
MAKKIYYGEKAFPGGMPRAAANNQGRPQQQTYYGSYPVTESNVSYETSTPGHTGTKTASVTFGDGTDYGYNVTTETFGNGERYINERGKRNGVMVDIDRMYSPDGIVLQNDTSYNGLTRGDVGFEQLQRQFEMPIEQQEEPLYPGTPDADINQQTPSTSQTPRWKQVASTVAKYAFPGAYALVKTGQKAAQVGTSRMKQGGYLRLQKQGGKLTEVWTPFN